MSAGAKKRTKTSRKTSPPEFYDLPKKRLLDLLRKMWQIRLFEQKVDEFFQLGRLHGTCHLYVGEEAVATGACSTLAKKDYFTSTHRGHGHCIASGADMNRMMAELLGKATGYCKGKGGSMHIADISSGNLGANGVVGGGFAMAAGAALTCKMKNTGGVVLCFFGDGAANQGVFHESANLAGVWKLPVIYICENNHYGMSLHVQKSTASETIACRGSAYGMPGVLVDGNDIAAVHDAVVGARNHALTGNGPYLIECITYRWMGHSKSDANRYRTKEEIEDWKTRCPILRYQRELMERAIATEKQLASVKAAAERDLEKAIEFADNSPDPDIATVTEDVYA